ncbi:MAG: di-heme enzyme [Vicinamibacterales bacterium]
MPRRSLAAARALIVLLPWVLIVAASAPAQPAAPFTWTLPRGFPEPRVPLDNPMTAEKVELGRYLFYDTRLSSSGAFACSTCHQQAHAFADDKARGVGVTGEMHRRGAMSLANVAYVPVLTWANPNLRRLEDQALIPMYGDAPIELGLRRDDPAIVDRLRREPVYQRLFPLAFHDDADPLSMANAIRAIASFERTLVSGGSPYDRYRTTLDERAIPPAAHRGQDLFFSDRIGCSNCHAGFNFAQPVDYVGRHAPEIAFHNTGLYNVDGRGSYPPADPGVFDVTHDPADMGRFRAPTLRNIALTAPYMHDGSLPTLDDVLDHDAAGGRRVPSGPLRGDGAKSPLKSRFITGFTLSPDERRDLIAFLNSLTDEAFVSDPRFSNPWPPK